MRRFLPVLLVITGLLWGLAPDANSEGSYPVYLPLTLRLGIQAPVLKWQRGGCATSSCETGWYSSPAIANLDGTGSNEVVGAAYSVFAVNGTTGANIWKVDPPGGRAWPAVVVANIDNSGTIEIVTAHETGYINVFNPSGNAIAPWPLQVPVGGAELRSLAVYDLEGDSDLEILVAGTLSTNQWYVYEHNATVRAGWPQHANDSNTNGYAAGAYNENIGVADVDHDGRGEIWGPSDVHYITAYEDNGVQLRANALYGLISGQTKVWSRVGVHVDHAVDLRGFANCGTEHRPNFADAAPTMADVNGDGEIEIIVVGNVYNCNVGHPPGLFNGLFVFNRDRTRWSGNGYDWTAIPVPDGAAAPISEDYDLIETAQPNPVVADLDDDGFKEILYASYDGRVHAYWLDKTEHGAWPYEVYKPAEGFRRFASEPVVVDLDNNGYAEVIFTSWTQKGSNAVGKLHIVDTLGNALHEVILPAPVGAYSWNGGLGAPTLGNIDNDADLEVVINTAHSGLVAYDLPNTAQARILWGTGRGTYYRNGTPPAP